MLRIEATPAFMTLTPGTEVAYRLISTVDVEVLNAAVDAANVQWNIFEATSTGKRVFSSSGTLDIKFKFDTTGRFTVLVSISLGRFDGRFRQQKKTVIGDFLFEASTEYPQTIAPETSLMKNPLQVAPPAPQAPPAPHHNITHVQDPFATLMALQRHLSVLSAVGTKKFFPAGIRFGIPNDPSGFAKHEAQEKAQQEYLTKLAEFVSVTSTAQRIPIRAEHLENSKGQRSEIRAFLAKFPPEGGKSKWMLIDWTNPADAKTSGRFEVTGDDDEDAVEKAIKAWENGNQYPPGSLTANFPAKLMHPADPPFRRVFKTTGNNLATAISEILAKIAFAAGLVAGVLLFLVPVPGAQVASAVLILTLTSAATGSAAAVLNIADRHNRGIDDPLQDGLDCLSAAASLLGAGASWAKGASFLVKASFGTKQFVFYGAVGVDAVQGVLLAIDKAKDLDSILDDKTLSPDDKISKLLEFFAKTAVSGAMFYVSAKSSIRDLSKLNVAQPPAPPPLPPGKTNPPANPVANLKKVPDTKATVDTTEPPTVTGDTKAGAHTTTVQGGLGRPPVRVNPYPGRNRVALAPRKPKNPLTPEEINGRAKAIEAMKKSHNDPDSLWGQEFFNKTITKKRADGTTTVIDGKEYKKLLDAWESGSPYPDGKYAGKVPGQSVKKLDVSGKTPEELHEMLTSQGFQHKRETLSNGEPMDFYLHPDGGMVRVKPEGDSANKFRSQPHVSKSVRLRLDEDTSFDNEAFKVTNDGVATPAAPSAEKGMRGAAPGSNSSAENNSFKDVPMEKAHTDLPSTPPPF